MSRSSKKWSLPKALSLIVGSIFAVTGSIFSLINGKHFFSVHSKKTECTHLILTGPQRDALSSYFIEEMLNLSQDQPDNIKKISLKKKKKMLLSAPMIKEANFFVQPPSTLYVDYVLREPIALVEDLPNMAIDEKGYLFPFSPFYSPKDLPSFYFGDKMGRPLSFETPISDEAFFLAKEILDLFTKEAHEERFVIKKIDVSCAFEQSLGKKEVVIVLAEDPIDPRQESISYLHYLRVSPKDYKDQLGHYVVLHKELLEELLLDPKKNPIEHKMIDLRLQGLAFIKKFQELE